MARAGSACATASPPPGAGPRCSICSRLRRRRLDERRRLPPALRPETRGHSARGNLLDTLSARLEAREEPQRVAALAPRLGGARRVDLQDAAPPLGALSGVELDPERVFGER